jgi:hypothetical protein
VLQEFPERDGLVHVVLGPGPQLLVLLEGLVARFARHDDERDVLQRGVFLELVADGEAVHPGQLDGQQDQVRPVGRRLLQPHVAVIDDRGAASELA